METTNLDIELIVRFLSGDATHDEKKQLLKWAELSEQNKKLYVELKDIWEVTQAGNSSKFDAEPALKRFYARVEKQKNVDMAMKHRVVYANIIKVAAIVVITFGLSWLVFSRQSVSHKQSATNQIIVPLGSKTQAVLPDGSRVWINAGSKLTYKNDFNDTNRIVQLDGEAFFDVVSNKKKPFVVKTGKIAITAYGTTFNVKSYSDDNYIETTLVEGSVTIVSEGTKKRLATLKPNQKSVYSKASDNVVFDNIVKRQENRNEKIVAINAKEKLLLAETNTENQTVWKDQKLYFVSETFDEIAAKLERWYGVKIHLLDNELKNQRFTGKFTHNEPLSQVLEAIKITTEITYSIKQNDVYISLKK